MKAPIALAVLITAAATVRAQSPPTPVPPAHSVEIVLERTSCFGTCPSYIVTLDGDGNVVYQGREFVRVTGEHRTKIDPAKVDDLVREFQRIGFFNRPMSASWRRCYKRARRSTGRGRLVGPR
jgi:hypothetical protein